MGRDTQGKLESDYRMKDAKNEDTVGSFSWWQDSHNRPPHTPWLQATLSDADVDEKTKVMESIMDQNDGDSLGRRVEMLYRRRAELVGTLQELELHRSHGSLAQRYRQLTSGSVENWHAGSSSVTVNGRSQVGYEVKPRGNGRWEGERVKKVEGRNDEGDGGLRLRVLKLTEESLYQQAELMRTNNHHREVIRHFCSRLNSLMDQHRRLNSTFLPARPIHIHIHSNANDAASASASSSPPL